MGTRHLICVVKNEEYKIAQYGQWDGYPLSQGLNILRFLRNEFIKDLFEEKLNNLSFITNEELKKEWEECGADPNSDYVTADVSKEHQRRYPQNSRNTGYGILKIVQNSTKPLKIMDSYTFAKDSLFCEWAYVIDLDKNTFEVYKGFNKKPLNKTERFIDLMDDESEYYPVRHIKSYSLDNLPTEDEFVEYFLSDYNSEEE